MREPRQEARGPDSRLNSHVTVWNPRICGLFLDDYWVTSLIRCVSFALAPALVLHLSFYKPIAHWSLCGEIGSYYNTETGATTHKEQTSSVYRNSPHSGNSKGMAQNNPS